MILLGILLGLIGTDVNSGMARFTFNISALTDGIGFVIVAMGVFGFTEVILNLELKGKREILTKKVKNLWLTKSEFKAAAPAVLRGTVLRFNARDPARRGRPALLLRRLFAGKENLQEPAPSSGKGPSKGSPRRRRRTMPGPRPLSSRFSPSASPPIR